MESEEEKESRLFVSPIANPLASDKLTKKLLKLTKLFAKERGVKKGVKETVKAVRNNTKGICLIAADVSPVDVLSHLPIMCENKGIAYIYLPSREAIGGACLTRRPTSCVLIVEPASKENKEKYAENEKLVRARNPYL